MKKFITLALPLLILFAAGCERKYKTDIYTNPDIEVCGVKDPANNIGWLKEQLDDYRLNDYYDSFHDDYCVYSDSAGELVIVIIEQTDRTGVRILNCAGDFIDGGYWSDPWYDFNSNPPTTPRSHDIQYSPVPTVCAGPPLYWDECDKFFRTHTFVDFIARIKTHL